ncbi:MAG: carboxypeptidase regulatory-like domain-containing protein [Gemmatimonadetes bacterium]|nr:carboxypeptidase regulatory-like domain-containing protein [Gemmatimonadota bacterium]
MRFPLRIRASLVLLAVCTGLPSLLPAQIFRGAVRTAATAQPIPLATVTARDSAGNVLAMATSDSAGLWALRVRRVAGPMELRVRRLGFEMGSYVVPAPQAADTIEYEFLLVEVAAAAEAVRVEGAASLNEKRLSEAYRRGWRVYEPELIASVRDRTADLPQLMRTLGVTSVYPPRGPNDCFRATRNNQCLAIVVDGLVLGPTALVLPNDVYFLAILGASEARVQFGDRAPFGAIAIYTRSRLDRPTRRP